MPLYSYRCDNCGVRFDRQQRFEDKPLKRCPECGKHQLRKLYLPVGIVFKGSGFYSTDSRSRTTDTIGKKDKKEVQAEAKPSASEGSSTEG